MIEFVSGDFFDYDADIRVNTVNCVGVMGTGVALLFKERYPKMFTEYLRACERKEISPGKPHVWDEYKLDSDITIINLPTKVDWRNPSEYEYVEDGLKWLKKFLSNKENSTVTLPALGCGHGGLEWEKVKQMIVEYLGDVNSKILVFEPSSSTKSHNRVDYEKNLKEQNIHMITPSDKGYPSKLAGRSALEFYYKGNADLINKKNIAIVTDSKPTEREKNALQKLLDILPTNEFVFLLGLNNSYETDLTKEVLTKGFKAVIVLPYGILQLKPRKDLESLWNFENIVVLSTTSPNQSWKSYEGANSLKLRLKLANITLINSLNFQYLMRYEKDIKQSENRVFYINYWNNNINFFSDLRAQKIGISSATKAPNVSLLLKSINEE